MITLKKKKTGKSNTIQKDEYLKEMVIQYFEEKKCILAKYSKVLRGIISFNFL